MIKVTRMNGLELVINGDLVEFLEATPDTVITLTTGKKFVLIDTVDEVIQKVIDYKRSIGIKVVEQIPQSGCGEE
ncbi:MAG: flagellar FlbD family protein [Bacillota bacterium]